MGQDARAGPEHVEASTGLEEVLEDPGELRVLVDVEEVREGLHHLPLLEETRRAFLSPARGRQAQERSLPSPRPAPHFPSTPLSVHPVQSAGEANPERKAEGGWGLRR